MEKAIKRSKNCLRNHPNQGFLILFALSDNDPSYQFHRKCFNLAIICVFTPFNIYFPGYRTVIGAIKKLTTGLLKLLLKMGKLKNIL